MRINGGYRCEFVGVWCWVGEPRKLEVGNFEDEIVTVDEDVGRLQATVDHSRAVRKT